MKKSNREIYLDSLTQLSEAMREASSAFEMFATALDFTLDAEVIGDVLDAGVVSDIWNED